MNVDYRKYAKFDYNSVTSPKDNFRLGDVVYKQYEDGTEDIGVIIQVHGNDEYRTDMFGNCCYDKTGKYGDIELATEDQIRKLRYELLA